MAKRTAPAVLAGVPGLADLKPDPTNARTHGDVNRARIRQSLAEAEGRTCYALELDPRFAQVIVERWERFTVQKAGRLAKGTPWPKGGS